VVRRRETESRCEATEEERVWGYHGRGGGVDGDGGDSGTEKEEGQEGEERVYGEQLFIQ